MKNRRIEAAALQIEGDTLQLILNIDYLPTNPTLFSCQKYNLEKWNNPANYSPTPVHTLQKYFQLGMNNL